MNLMRKGTFARKVFIQRKSFISTNKITPQLCTKHNLPTQQTGRSQESQNPTAPRSVCFCRRLCCAALYFGIASHVTTVWRRAR